MSISLLIWIVPSLYSLSEYFWVCPFLNYWFTHRRAWMQPIFPENWSLRNYSAQNSLQLFISTPNISRKIIILWKTLEASKRISEGISHSQFFFLLLKGLHVANSCTEAASRKSGYHVQHLVKDVSQNTSSMKCSQI